MIFTTFASSAPVLARAAPADFVPGEVVVGFANGQTAQAYSAQAAALASSVSAQVVDLEGNLALLSFAPDADVNALAGQLSSQAGISFAEPNFVYSIPEQQTLSTPSSNSIRNYVLRRAPQAARRGKGASARSVPAPTRGKNTVAIPLKNLQAMKRIGPGNKIMYTYPNDPYLWNGAGFGPSFMPWDFVGASVVWPNATASAGICEIDTGVDYLHPDLAGKVLKGKDFVNDDLDPMDDNGHGTHVAGIMVALKNNLKGIAGVSTGTVLAVKALDAQGFGTNFDIASAINYCAITATVKVINMSLGGPDDSTAIRNAIDFAVNTATVKKLVVAAAGNGGDDGIGDDVPEYPAFYSNNDADGSADCASACPTFPTLAGKVLAVAASGDDDDGGDYSCIAEYSNHGSWIDAVAPGTAITSTLPYDKPFYLNYYYFYYTRYGELSGTSMATPFVAAAAARRWGYKPLETNAQIGADVQFSGTIGTGFEFLRSASDFEVDADGTCFPVSMAGEHFVNVAALLDRGAAQVEAFDAAAGVPLNGATLQAYRVPGNALLGSGVITPFTYTDPFDVDPTRIYTDYTSFTDILNLMIDAYDPDLPLELDPHYTTYTYSKVNKTGYTASPQDYGYYTLVDPGLWSYLGIASVPPKSANFDVVAQWDGSLPDGNDLDSYVWLPSAPPNPLDSSQVSGFAVGPAADSTFGYSQGDSTGALTGFPFGRLKREGGAVDDLPVEDIMLSNRKAHNGLLANVALPYYPGTYTVGITDWGQTYDDDGDGCGDNYGEDYLTPGTDPGEYNPADDPDCPPTVPGGTLGIPLLGNALFPTVTLWKDGLVKGPIVPNITCSDHFWQPFTFTSGLSGSVSFNYTDVCDDAVDSSGDINPYGISTFSKMKTSNP
jgi:subtilisin family serine protease